jgi:hypothetical protein
VTAPAPPLARSLDEIRSAVRLANCPQCWQRPGRPCTGTAARCLIIGRLVTVTDGGWSGVVERIDDRLRAAYIRFPGRPDLVPYAFEALSQGEGVPGDHLARYQRAERRGLIGREDLAAVVAGLEVIAPHVIIRGGAQ